ncbi:cysteine-rich receptor-like protein kinase 25 [Cornus florida]|uniref:cysteine-rich receptor-like protein kinase 25 n=1 Tax=Cornus florida TaxID=4283 RepID=UPI002897AA89|nr:cysteine-rich receptor-like protein kinase 25 [Cornus florida]
MALTFHILFFLLFLLPQLPYSASGAQTWIKAGYWFSGSKFPAADINSVLFTHLICAYAGLNSSTYQLSITFSDNKFFSTFTDIVKQKNPSVATLLSIGGGQANDSHYSSMISQSSSRKSFIQSSINTARLYGFHGLDFCWVSPSTDSDMANIATLLDEWRIAIESESRNSSNSKLVLTMAVQFSPYLDSTSFPIQAIGKNLDWVHVIAYDYYGPGWANNTGAHAALYDPASDQDTDYGINAWINNGLAANKLVLGLPFYGYAWTLVNPNDSAIGAPAKGPAITNDGSMTYKAIKSYIQINGAVSVYNATYVVNYCIIGSSWIGFDDVEVVKIKVAYAKEKNLLGYHVWQVPNDDNWVLSQAAQGDDKDHGNKWRLLIILLTTGASVILLLGAMIWYLRKRMLKSRGTGDKYNGSSMASVGSNNSPNLQVFKFADIEAATNKFSIENKLGEGGYGPVYKGTLQKGQEIAVKRLSKASTQGIEEFKNEVMLTVKLQHVNLVRVLGFCTEKEEQILVYEYMPNKSLDYYIYDPIRRLLLDWEKRVHIIEGITQGLLYLQEYSRLTVIHRDLKGSNILLDSEMKPKISDFGMARIFKKEEFEANTSRIVGTYGYIPPEYVKHGIYSTKSDVFSFGVVLLHIISGKKNNCWYGPNENLNLLEYAYELWKEDNGMEFMDPSLDDTSSSCKLMRCMVIALLCVQEQPADRPSMLEVSTMLKNEVMVMNTPKRPAFSIGRDQDRENESTLRKESGSVDDATITHTVAR